MDRHLYCRGFPENRTMKSIFTRHAVRLTFFAQFLSVLTFLTPFPVFAQREVHESHEVVGWVPSEILQRPVSLRADTGNFHEKVSTPSAQAQAFYDQGLNYGHSYVWIEAARAFHQALRLDPGLAMAYVGLCDVYIALQDVPAARASLNGAQLRAKGITDLEHRRIEIRVRQLEFLEDRQNLEKFVAYRKAIYDGLMAYPSDVGLWILRGFADEGPMAGHGQTGDVDSIGFYKTALSVSPDNFAAHHYLAHSFENIGQTEEALKHSEAYLRLASSIPHAHHMHGHELRRAGRIEEAVEEFRKANELENAYYAAEKISPGYDWHRAHNLTLLAMCYQLLGQMKGAEQLLREASSLPAHGEIAEYNRKQWPEFLLQRDRPQEALDASQSLIDGDSRMAQFAGRTLMGRALVAMNRTEEAEKQLAQARNALVLLPDDADRLRPSSETLRAEILLAQKKSAEGVALIKQIEEGIRASLGPDARSQALFQLDYIARRARETQEWALAEFTARQMIEQDPTYAGGHFALGLAQEHAGDQVAAGRQFVAAASLWSEADTDLPELQRLRQKLSANGSKLPRNRQQYLEYVQDHPVEAGFVQPSKTGPSFDPARFRGNPKAPVIIVEFSDFQCPFCRQLQPTLKNLLARYEGRIGLAYRDFPLRELHPGAEIGAQSSRCAGEQGKFWEYHDLLFSNASKLTEEKAMDFARHLSLNEKKFGACLSSGKFTAEIEQDLREGIRAGVIGTPGIFINGVFLSGAQPEEAFERIIQAELANAEDRADP
jgi:protein-disulfide isomerase/tetratricopeptide (TPR) repeat protein